MPKTFNFSICSYEVIVNLCSILGLTSVNRNMLEPVGYEKTIQILVNTLVDYIYERCDKQE